MAKANPGDIIYADRGAYRHFGVYIRKNTIIHYATDDDSMDGSKAYIHETTPKKFAKKDQIYRLEFPNNMDVTPESIRTLKSTPVDVFSASLSGFGFSPFESEVKLLKLLGDIFLGHGNDENLKIFTPQETIDRAKSRLGERDYSLPFNNCEHFAIWCKTGLSNSSQVDRFIEVLISNSSKNHLTVY